MLSDGRYSDEQLRRCGQIAGQIVRHTIEQTLNSVLHMDDYQQFPSSLPCKHKAKTQCEKFVQVNSIIWLQVELINSK